MERHVAWSLEQATLAAGQPPTPPSMTKERWKQNASRVPCPEKKITDRRTRANRHAASAGQDRSADAARPSDALEWQAALCRLLSKYQLEADQP